MNHEQGSVLLVIDDQVATAVAASACRGLGLLSRCCAPGVVGLSAKTRPVAIVYDGEPLEQGQFTLHELRQNYPSSGLVGFPRMRPGVAPFLIEIGRTAGAAATGFWGTPSDRPRLSALLKQYMDQSPAHAVAQALGEILSAEGSISPFAIAEAIIRLRTDGARVSAATVAELIGTSERSFKRRWPATLGTPKAFSDSVTLILALYNRHWTGASWGRISTEFGVGDGSIRRLRRACRAGGSGELGQVFREFAERCGATPDQIERGQALLGL